MKILIIIALLIIPLASAQIAIIPDTQLYAERNSYSNLTRTMEWINNQSDIELVLFVGDIVSDPTNLSQWENMNKTISQLNKTYIIVSGNHDVLVDDWTYWDLFFNNRSKEYKINDTLKVIGLNHFLRDIEINKTKEFLDDNNSSLIVLTHYPERIPNYNNTYMNINGHRSGMGMQQDRISLSYNLALGHFTNKSDEINGYIGLLNLNEYVEVYSPLLNDTILKMYFNETNLTEIIEPVKKVEVDNSGSGGSSGGGSANRKPKAIEPVIEIEEDNKNYIKLEDIQMQQTIQIRISFWEWLRRLISS